MNITKRQRRDVQIPAVAWRHIKIECGNVARRFRLNPDDRADLEGEVGMQVRVAMAERYDPGKGKPYTYIQGVVKRQLCKWMERETRRRNDLLMQAVETAEHAAAQRQMSLCGRQDSVDDSSYSDEERWHCGAQEPARLPGEERPLGHPWLADERRIALVRRTVSLLTGTSRQICKLYLEDKTLDRIFEIMRARRWRNGLGTARFYLELWPKARVDFLRVWRTLEK